MGFSAVHVHFSRLNVPSHFIDYQVVLKAGMIPAILLAILATYVVWTSRSIRENAKLSALQIMPILPLMFLSILFLIIGTLFSLLLLVWCIAWVIHFPIDATFGISLSTRQLFYAGIGLFLVAGILQLIYRKFFGLTKRRWGRLFSKPEFMPHGFQNFVANGLRFKFLDSSCAFTEEVMQRKVTRQANGEQNTVLPKKQKNYEMSPKVWLYLLPLCWLIMPSAFIALFFATKTVIYLWDPALSQQLPSTNLLLWSGLIAGVFYSLSVTAAVFDLDGILNSQNRGIRLIGITEGAAALLITYVIFATLYTTKIYPNLGRTWGGGRPASISICLAKDDIPNADILKELLPHASIGTSKDTLCIDSVFLVHSTKENSIIIDKMDGAPSGMVVSNDRIQLITCPR